MTNLMKSYSQINTLSCEERVFNYRLSRARRVLKNAFGIIANRFKVLLNPIATKLKTVDDIVLACCALHIFYGEKVRSIFNIPMLNKRNNHWKYIKATDTMQEN